jgi:hypothetical protein
MPTSKKERYPSEAHIPYSQGSNQEKGEMANHLLHSELI